MIDTTTESLIRMLDSLASRWEDERGYEDFAEYRKAWASAVRREYPDAKRITFTAPQTPRCAYRAAFSVGTKRTTIRFIGQSIFVEEETR
jgi:hypothetical protein